VFELTKVATRNIEATDTDKLNQLIGQLADVTQGKREQITTLLTSVAQLSNAINARDGQLRELLDRSDQLSGTLADKDQTLVALIDQSQGVLDLVARRRDDIAAGLHSGNLAVGELAGVLDRNMGQLNAILNALHPTLDTVDRRQADLDKALSIVGPGALGLGKAAAHGPWADVYVRDVGPDVIALLKSLNLPKPPVTP
jgi:phospholipid/cholesterol/gamma-HCH transport system substrate-binding protein